MSNGLVTLLVATNLATGAGFYHFYQLDQKHTETRTTDVERENFGKGCVDWLNEDFKPESKAGSKLYLGRSWRKHGQMVFEIFSEPDLKPEERVDALCTYDLQSGMMFQFRGASRDMWMFYE